MEIVEKYVKICKPKKVTVLTGSKEDYEKQFSIRALKLLERLDRIERIYKEEDAPEVFHNHLEQQRERLIKSKERFGKDTISPFEFE